jgi:hypothetical protein
MAKQPKHRKRMAQACGWDKKKRIPKAWLLLGPGQEYATTGSKFIGRNVSLKGMTWKVVGITTPVATSSRTIARRAARYVCQGGFSLADPANPHSTSRKVQRRSVVRSAVRREDHPTKLCDRQAQLFGATLADLDAIEREASAAGVHPWELVGDYEFPHTHGAGPACPHADAAHREAFDPDEEWKALRGRVRRRQPKAAMSSTRAAAMHRARTIREGGDTGDASYLESLRGGEGPRRR